MQEVQRKKSKISKADTWTKFLQAVFCGMLSATKGEINLTNGYPQNQILPWLFLVRAAGAYVPKGMFSQQELLKCKEIKLFLQL